MTAPVGIDEARAKERPILFSASMVKAILAGAKTQTRRVVTVHWHKGTRALPYEPWFVEEDGRLLVDCSERDDSHGNGDYREFASCMPCPYGRPGDRLWVRETWQHTSTERAGLACVAYRADGVALDAFYDNGGEGDFMRVGSFATYPPVIGKWRPSIFMPRGASRITLEVTEVRVEKVQAISAQDSLAEGATLSLLAGIDEESPDASLPFQVQLYARLWNSINGKRPGCSWAANPWVWVVGFRRLEENAR